ncbi:PQQ-binding-like beta-propeller repeat protein [Blastopirellula sp. JC732]|uniref:PQQ-binding-like beta-propeller repeat protein n=1 Tax=Blastopirellula sediminis TaxID=2894196 RepID=A0A9X1MQS6_9BACT|nr:PQQ-binding-like beta-propeller repeat protein [Blastopirellula sediminis]MCC9606365.1 PQQ-binding-like beta-propeller repeat protein [Blastopirellula sediminis]MCC9630337.1 PQQ-binding-like beta-propeller repeat protein [Blastopirellula sediminis]
MRHYFLFLALLLPVTWACSPPPPAQEVRSTGPIESTASPITVSAADWPWWRAATHDNHAVGPAPPTEIGPQTVIWETEVPGHGHSTPILLGETLYLTTADESAQIQSLLAFDAKTGEKQWAIPVHEGKFMHMHPKNTQASATPATDGTNIYTLFMVDEGIWATAVSPEGKIVWQTKAGPFHSQHGYGSSPLIYESLLIIQGDCKGSGFVAALDRGSGDVVWRTSRPHGNSYGTPTIAKIGGKDQLILCGQDRLISYDPQTGEPIWNFVGLSETTANTPQAAGDTVYVSGGYPDHFVMAIDAADASGELDRSHVIWEEQKKVYVPSLLVDGEFVYAIGDDGVAVCYDAATGDTHWKKRLGGGFSASPTLIGDLIYVPNEDGEMFVLKTGEKFEQVSSGKLEGGGFASPVIVDGRLYWRTTTHLYCLGEK